MKVYVGQTGSRVLIARLRRYDIGECVVRGGLPPRRQPWFYDNGAWGDFQADRDFNVTQYVRDLRRIAYWPMPKPDFLVLPDLVGAGVRSLSLSADWIEWSASAGAPMYLAVQDGMQPSDLSPLLPAIAGLFVGGTLNWKLRTTPMWVEAAHAARKAVHVGRIGIPDRVEWARLIGVDSIDSSQPLWCEEAMDRFLASVSCPLLFPPKEPK